MIEILIFLGVTLGLVLTGVLNRLRGTGLIKYFGTLNVGKYNIEIKLVWNHIYGLYFALIFGYLTASIGVGVVTLVAYLVGESKGWGEWVGALTRWELKDEKWLEEQYLDKEGKTFPFIHQIANYVVPEKIDGTLEQKLKQYNIYAILATTLRGTYWFLPMTLVAIFTGLISWYFGLISLVLVGLAFPLACWLGRITNINGKIGIVNYSRGWENQEVYYGVFHGVWTLSIIVSSIGG